MARLSADVELQTVDNTSSNVRLNAKVNGCEQNGGLDTCKEWNKTSFRRE